MREGKPSFAEGTNPGTEKNYIAERRQKLDAEHKAASGNVLEDATLKAADALKYKKNQKELAARAAEAELNRQLENARKRVGDQRS